MSEWMYTGNPDLRDTPSTTLRRGTRTGRCRVRLTYETGNGKFDRGTGGRNRVVVQEDEEKTIDDHRLGPEPNPEPVDSGDPRV